MNWFQTTYQTIRSWFTPSAIKRTVSLIEPYAELALPIVEQVEQIKAGLETTPLTHLIAKFEEDTELAYRLFLKVAILPKPELFASIALYLLRKQAPTATTALLRCAIEFAYLTYKMHNEKE